MADKYTVHTWSESAVIGREVAAFESEQEAMDFAYDNGTCYADGLYICRPDKVVILGDDRYSTLDGVECDEFGEPLPQAERLSG